MADISEWKLEQVHINDDGMRVGVSRTDEYRGKESEYDAWLRIPEREVGRLARDLLNDYLGGIKEFYSYVDRGGINHINRELLSIAWRELGAEPFNVFYQNLEQNCSVRVRILAKQYYAHRLYISDNATCKQLLLDSIALTKQMPNPSWDKWIVSGYVFLARYSSSNDDKAKYCIAALNEPQDLKSLTPHLKFWKLFRAAAWLIANNIKTDKAIKGIDRYRSLEFRGYTETRGSDCYTCDTFGKFGRSRDYILDSPEACAGIMTREVTNIHGNP